jgi:hypothetical protein
MRYNKKWCEAVTEALTELGIDLIIDWKNGFFGNTPTFFTGDSRDDSFKSRQREIAYLQNNVEFLSKKLSALEKYLNIKYTEESIHIKEYKKEQKNR